MLRLNPASKVNAIIKTTVLRLLLAAVSIVGMASSARAASSIEFWAVTGSDDDVAMFKRLASDFNQKTGIEVHVTPLSWGNFATKYFTSMAAEMPPDIGATNLGGPMDYGSVGGLVDLKTEFPTESAELVKHIYPRLLPMFTWRGQLFGLPAELSTLAVFYRTDTFNRLGIQPPKTWKELEQDIRRLEAAGYHYYFGFTSRSQWAMGIYSMPYGLPGLAIDSKDTVHVDWTNPIYRRSAMRALNLWNAHDAPGSDQMDRIPGMFKSDDPSIGVPLVLEQPNLYLQLPIAAPEINGKWGVVPWPKAEDGKEFNIVGGTAYVMFRRSKHKKEALEWLKYLYSVPVQEAMILDHANRKVDPAFEISPVVDMWGQETQNFWERPALAKVIGLKRVLQNAMPSLTTLPQVNGQSDTGLVEAGVLDRMGTAIADEYSSAASRHNMSRWELIRSFAQGKYLNEEQDLQSRLKQRLANEYSRAGPEARQIIEKSMRSYDQRFGRVISHLGEYEKRSDALTLIKWIAASFLLMAIVAVAAIPKLRKHWISYAFVAAPVVAATVFIFIPAATALYLSMTQYHPVLPLSSAIWTGFSNYADVFASGDLYRSIAKTLLFLAISLPVSILISLPLAWLLNQKIRGQRGWRFLYFSPMVTSVVSIALIFTQLFLSSTQGWLNSLFLSVHLVRDPIQFLKSERSFLYCAISVAVWQGLAFNILIFLAGLQQIPQDLYEAAAVDGANLFRRFRSISLPGIRAQMAFICILGVIGGFQVFEPIYILGGGAGEAGAKFGPNDSGMTMVPLIYHTGFETFDMGRSTAIAYILFAIIMLFSLGQLRLFRGKEEMA